MEDGDEARRTEARRTIAREQKVFANAWFRSIVDMMGSASAVSAKTSERDHKSVE
jgi:hypothetical protein